MKNFFKGLIGGFFGVKQSKPKRNMLSPDQGRLAAFQREGIH